MLGNLCWIYDSNRITIEGHTDLAFSDDVAARFLAYGWNVERVGDANDTARVAEAIEGFQRTHDVPTLIVVDSHIGYGAPHKQDTSAAHGEPLGEEEIRLAKRSYGWPEDAKFLVPEGVREHFRHGIGRRGRQLRAHGRALFASYRQEVSGARRSARSHAAARAAARLGRGAAALSGRPQGARHPRLLRQGAQRRGATPSLADRRRRRPRAVHENAPDASRAPATWRRTSPADAICTSACASMPWGRSSTGSHCPRSAPSDPRFLIFSDYMKPPIRLAALMELPVIYVFTHDFDRGGRRRTDASAGRAAARAAQRFRASSRFAPPMPTRWSKPGAS